MKKFKGFRKLHRFKRKRPIFRNRYFWISILSLIGAWTIFYFLTFAQTFQVREIIVKGENRITTEEIKSIAEKWLEKKILALNTKSVFLVDPKVIRENILKSFPQIREIKIKRGLPNFLNIIVSERVGVATFCHHNQCFLLDGEGIIFESAPSDSYLLRIQSAALAGQVSLGKRAVEEESLQKIQKITSSFKDNSKILIREVLIVSEERLNIKTVEGWEIYLNPEDNIESQLQKLELVLEKQIPPDKRKDLEYIDLRFGNQAYYKYR